MGICIENQTGATLRIWDRYVQSLPLFTGYDGGIDYTLIADEKISICSSTFRNETMNHMLPQMICVLRADCGETPELILSHDEFDNNDGCKLVFVIKEDDGGLSYSFVRNEDKGFLQKLWKHFFTSFGLSCSSSPQMMA